VLDDAATRYPIDAARVGVTGFSNGAAMAFRYAAERAGRVAAVAPVAGHCNVEPRPSRPVPTLYLTGRDDPLVPLAGGEIVTPWGRSRVARVPVSATLAKWAAAIGCSTTPRTIESAGGVTVEEFAGPVPMRAVTIDGLGHHWPGGRGELLRRIAGPPSARVDACGAVWDFFRAQVVR
jgi:polyhydroxybutyrate depolymerase